MQGLDPTPNSCISASDSYTSSRPRPFWQRPPCTNTQALRAQAMAADHQEFNFTIFPECLPSNSVTGSSAKSERGLGLERYLVKMSATFLSPPIFLTTTIPSSILSCAHSVLVSTCLTFTKPFLVAIPFAAEESVDKVMLKSRPMSFAIPLIARASAHALDHSVVLGFTARERHHCLCRSPRLQQVAPVEPAARFDSTQEKITKSRHSKN